MNLSKFKNFEKKKIKTTYCMDYIKRGTSTAVWDVPMFYSFPLT